MKARDFWNKFKKLFEEGSDSLKIAQENWDCERDFTNEFINKKIPEIMNNEKRYKTEFEYFRIDIIAYTQRKEEAKAIEYNYNGEYYLKPYLWDLEIAFEHENKNREWLDEIVKLSHIRCPLRVVVGYAPIENRDVHVKYAANVLSKKLGNGLPDEEEFMLILGESKIKSYQVNESTYIAYKYENGEFIEL
jgi:hypothetical protein